MIKQRQEYDCGVAALAMMLSLPYEEILTHFNTDFSVEGLSVDELCKVIRYYGEKPFIHKTLHLTSPGILFVPSYNHDASGHFVYWAGPGKLYDPSQDVCYNPLDDMPLIISHILIPNSKNRYELMSYYEQKLEQLDT